MEVTAGALAQMINGKVEGNPNTIIRRPSGIEDAGEGCISFISNPKYNDYVYTTKASVLLVSEDFETNQPVKPTLIRVKDVYSTVALLLQTFAPKEHLPKKIDEQCFVHLHAQVGTGTSVGAFAYISEGAVVGENCTIYPQVFIGKNVKIEDGTTLFPGVKVYHNCKIGKNCILQANVIVGSDGFGFAPQEDGSYKKIAQIGNVVIGNEVEIGANTVIDRATMGTTLIKDGVKLDNLIQIAHNVEIDENTVIAAQTGIAGSTKVGKNCQIGGQVGMVGHIQIADGAKIQAQSGINRTIKNPDARLYGSPALPYNDYLRAYSIFRKLPALQKRITELEKQLKEKG